MYAQGYFAYDSKKSGGVTISHLRFGNKPIKSTYLINKADFVACHNPSYVDKYDMVEDLKHGRHLPAQLLVGCGGARQSTCPAKMKRYHRRATTSSSTPSTASTSAKEIGLGGRINTVLQAAFFKLANIIPADDAIKYHEGRRHRVLRQEGREDRRDEPRRHRPRRRRTSRRSRCPRTGPSAEDNAVHARRRATARILVGSIVNEHPEPGQRPAAAISCRFPPL